MKQFIALLAFITSISAHAQQEKQIMRFWDSTFAYNMLIINDYLSQPNLLHIEMSGTTLGIGEQMQGLKVDWGTEDRVDLYIPKSDCQIDTTAKTFHCERAVPTSVTIAWTETPATSRRFHWSIKNIVIDANSTLATMSFNIEDNPYFKSSVDQPSFSIPVRIVD